MRNGFLKETRRDRVFLDVHVRFQLLGAKASDPSGPIGQFIGRKPKAESRIGRVALTSLHDP